MNVSTWGGLTILFFTKGGSAVNVFKPVSYGKRTFESLNLSGREGRGLEISFSLKCHYLVNLVNMQQWQYCWWSFYGFYRFLKDKIPVIK